MVSTTGVVASKTAINEKFNIDTSEASKLLKALANENRLRVLCYLDKGELSVSELNERLALSQSALSQHLAVLRRDGIVQTRRASQTIYYSLSPGKVTEVIRTLRSMYQEE